MLEIWNSFTDKERRQLKEFDKFKNRNKFENDFNIKEEYNLNNLTILKYGTGLFQYACIER